MRVEIATLPPAGGTALRIWRHCAYAISLQCSPISGDRDHLMFILWGVICLRVGVTLLRFQCKKYILLYCADLAILIHFFPTLLVQQQNRMDV